VFPITSLKLQYINEILIEQNQPAIYNKRFNMMALVHLINKIYDHTVQRINRLQFHCYNFSRNKKIFLNFQVPTIYKWTLITNEVYGKSH